MALLLVVFLFAVGTGASTALSGSLVIGIAGFLCDFETQRMIPLILGIYLAAFIFLRSRAGHFYGLCEPANPDLWLASLLVVCLALYATNYSPCTPALILLGGAAVGQLVAMVAHSQPENVRLETPSDFYGWIIIFFVVLLAIASVWNGNPWHLYEYHSSARRSGPWDNPNTFGMLMGTGIVLAVGHGVQNVISKINDWKTERAAPGFWLLAFERFSIVSLCLLAAILMARGLFHSYSRGAWLGTACGLASLFWLKTQSPRFKVRGISRVSFISRFKTDWFPLSVMVVSIVVLFFWHLRETNWHPARRAISALNPVDFSWRNRVVAWEGALQIMAERP